MIKLWPVTPVPAPRQVHKDKFNPSLAVRRYRAFRDELRLRQVWIPLDYHHVLFLLPMPTSWKPQDRLDSDLMPHRQTPDRDNLEKALLDATFENDCQIWNGQTTKLWSQYGMIIVADHPLPTSKLIADNLYSAYRTVVQQHTPFAVLSPQVFAPNNSRSI